MNPIYVIGHKNPDTDSICSAIAYARLKSMVTGQDYRPRRAGAVNEETAYVLKRFGVEAPPLLETLEPRAADVPFHRSPGISADASLLQAWQQMVQEGIHTLGVVKKGRLLGIVTLGDLAQAYWKDLDCTALSRAGTRYRNLTETLAGRMLSGDPAGRMEQERVIVHNSGGQEPGNLVLVGEDKKDQVDALKDGAGGVIVCSSAAVSDKVLDLAQERNCPLIVTPYDIYTASRMLGQAIPVRAIMKTEGIVTFDEDDFVTEMRTVMARRRFRCFPVLNEDGKYIGMVTQRNLLELERQRVVLVDHNERAQAVDGVLSAEILEIIDHHRLGNIETMQPVYFRNQPLGCTATILNQIYHEKGTAPDPQTAGLMLAAILSDTLMFRSPTCTTADEQAARELAELAGVDLEELALAMFRAGSDLGEKTEQELFDRDCKVFACHGIEIAAGQVSSVSPEQLEDLRQRMEPYVEKVRTERQLDIVLFLMTNILDESSTLLFSGPDAAAVVERAFGPAQGNRSIRVPGLLSRKKQLVPAVMQAIRQLNE